MTADTYSNTLGWLMMVTGNDNNAWGNNANTAIFQIFEDAIANVLTSAVTGGTLDLSGSPPPAAASQVRYAGLVFTGTLTGNQIVKVPNLTKFWWVKNSTSGAFTLTIQTPSGTGKLVEQVGGWQCFTCDAANNIDRASLNSVQLQPIGTPTAAVPSYSSSLEANSGWYRNNTQDWRLSINGVDVLQCTGTGGGTPSVINVLSPNALQVAGVPVATGSAVTATGAITNGHIAQWASSTTIQDGGVLGSLAALSSVKASTLDSGGSALDQWALTNLSLAVTVGSNLLTVTLNGANGSTPSSSNPVLVNFQDNAGNPVPISIQAATSIATHTTGNSGDTLGTTNNVPFRVWVALFNNGGTAVLALINYSDATHIYPFNEFGVASTTPFNTGTLAGVFYTPFGTTLSGKQFRIIGCLNYETALATAGTYNNPPDTVRLLTPGVKKPGDVVQVVYFQTASGSSLTGSAAATNITSSITPTSKANLIQVNSTAVASAGISGTSTSQVSAQVRRGTSTSIGEQQAVGIGNSAGVVSATLSFDILDAPGVSASQAYTIYANNNVGSGSLGAGTMRLTEIMG